MPVGEIVRLHVVMLGSMLHNFLSMLTTSVLGAETPLETASLQQANGHLQASPALQELFGRDPGSVNGRRYICLIF